MANLDEPFRRSNAIIAISTACLSPLRIGSPLATMYESFIVSTLNIPYDCYIDSRNDLKYQGYELDTSNSKMHLIS